MKTELLGHVNEEILRSLPDIKHSLIESENPKHHWNLVKADNETVLDLGCGFHMIQEGWQTTPDYFLSKGAKKIIGVDSCGDDIAKLKKSLPHHDFHCDFIDSLAKLDRYINQEKATSLKMDIEGYESLFFDSENEFISLKYLAIETHSRALLNRGLIKLQKMDFKIEMVCTFYPRVHDVCNLIYASR